MKAIVLGANGYLGQNLCRHLVQHGVRVLAADLQAQSLADGGIDYRRLDITNAGEVQQFDWEADVLYFLSGLTGTRASIERAGEFLKVNEGGLVHVLEVLARRAWPGKLVFPSTRLVYKGAAIPLLEDSEKDLKTVYALSKFSGERLLQIFHGYYALRYTVLRLCVLYGDLGTSATSYGTIDFMLQQARGGTIKIFGDGQQRRSFVHVGDVAAIMHAVAADIKTDNQIFNVGGEDLSIREVAAAIAGRTAATVCYVDWPEAERKLESGSTVLSDERLQRLLHYRYRYHFSDYLQKLQL